MNDVFQKWLDDWRKLLDKTPYRDVEYRGTTIDDIRSAVDDAIRRAKERETLASGGATDVRARQD